MRKVDKKENKIAWIVSCTIGLIIILTACLTLLGTPLFDEYILFALVITVFPPAVLDYLDHRWRRSIDEHLPDLFQSIVRFQQTGMTISQTLREVSKRDYGNLSKELEKMENQMSWGVSFEEAFISLGERVDTALMRQVVSLIIEANRSGGNIEKALSPLGRFLETILTFEKERKAQTRPYMAIIYIAFFVFLFTIIILFKTFFTQITELSILRFAILTSEETRRILFHMSVVQAFFGGLIAGKMGEGTMSAGLKHIVILLTFGYLALKFVA